MTGPQLDQATIQADAVRQVATPMAAAAITAPKSGGQLFPAGKPNPLETVAVTDPDTRRERSLPRARSHWATSRGHASLVAALLAEQPQSPQPGCGRGRVEFLRGALPESNLTAASVLDPDPGRCRRVSSRGAVFAAPA